MRAQCLVFGLLATVAIALPAAAVQGAGQDGPPSAPATVEDDGQGVATALLDHLDAGRFDQAEALLSMEMKAAVSAAALRNLWGSLPPAGTRTLVSAGRQDDMRIVVMRLMRGEQRLLTITAVDPQGQVAGFFVKPDEPVPAALAPPPADAPYTEQEVSVGQGQLALGATLAMPKGAGPFPAVVLVHGSGPQDRNQRIGPNHVFADLARGLAARGIAVLRYDKRTKARPQDFADAAALTIDSETTVDAVEAVNALRGLPGIDPRRVFVLGHSQGGMLAPRIAAKAGDVAGIILFAAPARRLLDVLLEQNQRLAAMDGSVSAPEQQAIDGLQAAIAAVRSDPATPAAQAPMRLPAGYWRSTDAVDALAEAEALDRPMLLLQGGRDLQVVAADWALWQQRFAGNAKATFRHYDALNHLGIAGSGPATLAEYGQPGQVDATLIDDIAAWIRAITP